MAAIVYLIMNKAERGHSLVVFEFMNKGKLESFRLRIVLVVWDWHSSDVMKLFS